jgi:hypothetical protein
MEMKLNMANSKSSLVNENSGIAYCDANHGMLKSASSLRGISLSVLRQIEKIKHLMNLP